MKKYGLIMLLTICLLFPLSSAVAAEMQAEAVIMEDYGLTENKIMIGEEVTAVISCENVAAFAVSPIQIQAVFYNYLFTVDYLYFPVLHNFTGSVKNKTSAMPGGDLLYAGFV